MSINKLLIRCPKCTRENYAPNVPSGICTWCLYDVNAIHCPKCNREYSEEDAKECNICFCGFNLNDKKEEKK